MKDATWPVEPSLPIYSYQDVRILHGGPTVVPPGMGRVQQVIVAGLICMTIFQNLQITCLSTS